MKTTNNLAKQITLMALLLFTANSTLANDNDPTKYDQIKKITQQIKSIKLSIKDENKKKDKLSAALKSIELSISSSDKKLRSIKAESKKNNKELETLKAKEVELKKSLSKQKSMLAEHLKHSYTLGKQPHIKLILNQEDPKEINRQIIYLEHLNKARVSFIDHLIENMNSLEETKKQIATNAKNAEKLLNEKMAENSKLKQNEKAQQQLIYQINDRIKTEDQKLRELTTNKQDLENIIAKVTQQKVTSPLNQMKFSKLKGKLTWPIKGKVDKHISIESQHSKIKYAGVFIEAAEQDSVNAVFPGTVVFADWMQGFGLLLILDHGDGYMSLYGHNRDLLKQMDDPVEAGEQIATAGRSGGNQQSGLYFEIRHNGHPEDPSHWCA